MNDLTRQGTISDSKQPSIPPSISGPGLGKEGEAMSVGEQPIQEIHKELELSKEVVAAGVKMQPTVVILPKPVQQMGVRQIGVNTGLSNRATISLPLTQPQIAKGLQDDIQNSWRWLAVWCMRKLKQFRLFQIKKQ